MTTTTTKTTTRKPATRRKTPVARKAAPKVAPKAAATRRKAVEPKAQPPEVAVHTAHEELPVSDMDGLKKKELIDMVVARSGVKKRDAKPAIEAALSILGETLSEGRALNLPGFGKLKVTRMKKGDNGQIINARVRQASGPAQAEKKNEISLSDPLSQSET
jgi:DNA-binding protein HU-alpha